MNTELEKIIEVCLGNLENRDSIESRISYCAGYFEKEYPEITKLLDVIMYGVEK